MTNCKTKALELKGPCRRSAVVNFDGGDLTSDGGMPILKVVEGIIGLFDRITKHFKDDRDPNRTRHSLLDIISQRIFSLTMGHEDLNDHEELSRDSLLAFVVGKRNIEECFVDGKATRPLASSSTLNRLELAANGTETRQRHCKFSADIEGLQSIFLDLYFESYKTPPKQVILDVDHTDVPLHGDQEDKFFHGYYKSYCYLPLFIFAGEQLLSAKLRTADGNTMRGTLEEIQRVALAIKKHWPDTKVIVRGDSGFSRDELMIWLEDQHCFYIFGLGKNSRLVTNVQSMINDAEVTFDGCQEKQRWFKTFKYQTQNSWSQSRQVVGKVEHTLKGSNVRFIVTNLSIESGQKTYDELYCARGESENRMKETQLYMFGDRLSGHEYKTNELRLLFSGFAYVLLETLRRLGLKDTKAQNWRCDTIRKKLLKIGAKLKVTVRHLWVELSSFYVHKGLYIETFQKLSEMKCQI